MPIGGPPIPVKLSEEERGIAEQIGSLNLPHGLVRSRAC